MRSAAGESPSARAHDRPRGSASLAHSARILLARPGVIIALGTGSVLALLSLCCGIGVVLAPWLLCELLSVQLGEALGRPIPHRRSWAGACLILFGAVALTASVGWLSWLGLAAAPAAPQLAPAAVLPLFTPGALLSLGSALISVVFVLPFMYAPLILIESRADLGGAVLESARLVARGGTLPHLWLLLAANSVQLAPLFAALSASSLRSNADIAPLLAAFSVPLLCLSVPLGEGMVVSAYSARRDDVADFRRVRLAGRPPLALVALWILLVAAPVLSFGLLGASLVRPSRLPAGELPHNSEIVADIAPLRHEQRVHPVGTALEIVAGPGALRVVASDGGGAGLLPLRSAAPIEALRVARVRELYAIEVEQAGRHWLTWIDRAGVRHDDDLRARLLDRVPSFALWAMLASLLSTASALLPVLVALAELRRLYAADPGARPAPRAMSEQRARTIRRAFAIALLLSPLSGYALYWGLRSAFG